VEWGSFGLLQDGASLAVGEAVGFWSAVIQASMLGNTVLIANDAGQRLCTLSITNLLMDKRN
jgi:hypothetical protein